MIYYKCPTCDWIGSEDDMLIDFEYNQETPEHSATFHNVCPNCEKTCHLTDYEEINITELLELKNSVYDFFENFLNVREESDSGKIFAPIYISNCRALKIEPLGNLLEKMRLLSGANLPNNYDEW